MDGRVPPPKSNPNECQHLERRHRPRALRRPRPANQDQSEALPRSNFTAPRGIVGVDVIPHRDYRFAIPHRPQQR